MFIPRSIKRKQRDFIDSHDIHFNKKQALDNGQTESNPSTTVAATITQQKEENTIDNIPKEDQISNTHSINYSKNDDIHTDTSVMNESCLMTNNEIKQFSSQQRLIQPNQDEPTCIVCGKYGEYINDDTDHDVCSMECKYIDTDLTPISISKSAIIKKEEINNILLKIPQPYTANNVHAKYTNYMESESVQALTPSDTKAILKANGLQVNGSRLPRPITSFDQCYTTFGDQLYKNIENELGWHMATPLQRMVIPIGLAGRDMIVTAPTHSGKTGSYLIPLIVHCQTLNRLHQYKRRGGPYALIIAPTRELCQQIESITKKLITQLRCLRTGLLIGGQPIAQQLYRLRKGVQIIIGTPGRLVEIATHHPALLRLWMLRIIVLDEADAIFGLGFEKQMKLIFQKLSTHATIQKCVFSATLSENDSLVQKKIQPYFNNNNDDDPVQIKLQLDDEYDDNEMKKKPYDRQQQQQIKTASLLPSPLVRQTILWVENDKKAKRLFSILNNPKYFLPPILIFVESRLGAEFLSRAIQKRYSSWRVVTMHADKDQQERMAVIEGMNQKDSNGLATWDIVVTTDILARGVDLPCVRLVINYDMAATEEDYIHRIGRAILPGSLPRFKNQYQQHRGWAITFINKEHEYLLPRFTKMLSNKSLHQVTPLPSQLKKYL